MSSLCSVGVILATALGISVAAVALHGSLRTPDDLFTDDIEVRLMAQCVPTWQRLICPGHASISAHDGEGYFVQVQSVRFCGVSFCVKPKGQV